MKADFPAFVAHKIFRGLLAVRALPATRRAGTESGGRCGAVPNSRKGRPAGVAEGWILPTHQ
jgi:hypothetical protein